MSKCICGQEVCAIDVCVPSLQQRLHTYVADNENLRAQLAAVTKELGVCQAALRQNPRVQQDELARLQKTVDHKDEQMAELQEHVERLTKERDEARANVEEYAKQWREIGLKLQASRSRCKALEAALRETQHTTNAVVSKVMVTAPIVPGDETCKWCSRPPRYGDNVCQECGDTMAAHSFQFPSGLPRTEADCPEKHKHGRWVGNGLRPCCRRAGVQS